MSNKISQLSLVKINWYVLSLLTAFVSVATPSLAQSIDSNAGILDRVQNYSQEGKNRTLDQVTNVNQLQDVSPSDWAYEALRSLVERYGCIAGYPNSTFRGDRAITRYEFAAGLNACLNQIERLIASSESVLREDIEKLNRLSEEFQAELATLRGRVDGLEARTAELEENQFSTTTKLTGEVIFGLGSVLAGDADKVPVFGNRARLELNTSFTGEDSLYTRLSAGNFPGFADETETFEGDLGFNQDDDNDLGLEVLQYGFPIGDRLNVTVSAAGGAADDVANTVNLFDGDGADGAVSAFGTRNPIYYPPDGAGVGATYELGEKFELAAAYLAGSANDPTAGNGLFNGAYSTLGQILFKPNEKLNFAFLYVHSYNQSDTETGTSLANLQSFTEGDSRFNQAVPTSSNAYGLQFSWQISDRIVLGGWGGFSKVTTLSSLGGTLDRGSQDIWNWAVTLGLPDLGKEGNLGGLVVGMEPFVADSSIDTLGDDRDTSLHVEAFYKYKLNDNIAVTPGVVWITAPNGDNDNDDQVIGTVRTTFNF